jgi:hypothetical protein
MLWHSTLPDKRKSALLALLYRAAKSFQGLRIDLVAGAATTGPGLNLEDDNEQVVQDTRAPSQESNDHA